MTLLANAPVAMTITLVVILIGSSLFGLGSGRTRTIQPLGPQRKRLALGVVLIQRDQWPRLRSQYAGEVLAPLVPKYVGMAILRARAFETGACLVDSAVGHARVVGRLFCKESG